MFRACRPRPMGASTPAVHFYHIRQLRRSLQRPGACSVRDARVAEDRAAEAPALPHRVSESGPSRLGCGERELAEVRGQLRAVEDVVGALLQRVDRAAAAVRVAPQVPVPAESEPQRAGAWPTRSDARARVRGTAEADAATALAVQQSTQRTAPMAAAPASQQVAKPSASLLAQRAVRQVARQAVQQVVQQAVQIVVQQVAQQATQHAAQQVVQRVVQLAAQHAALPAAQASGQRDAQPAEQLATQPVPALLASAPARRRSRRRRAAAPRPGAAGFAADREELEPERVGMDERQDHTRSEASPPRQLAPAAEFGATQKMHRIQRWWRQMAARHRAYLAARRFALAEGAGAAAFHAYREFCASHGYAAEATEAALSVALDRVVAQQRAQRNEAERVKHADAFRRESFKLALNFTSPGCAAGRVSRSPPVVFGAFFAWRELCAVRPSDS